MLREQKVLAVVPARIGSKRLPRKNLLPLCGRPLIGWSIEAGLSSGFIDKVVVSTEDEEIKNIAIKNGVDGIINRPNELATDEALTVDVLIHAIQTLKSLGEIFQWVILLQPTSPLRTYVHIDDSFVLLDKKRGKGLVSICETDHPMEWSGILSEDGFMDTFFQSTDLSIASQNCRASYRINGAIYISRVDLLLSEHTIFLKKDVVAFVMDRRDSIDIDEKYDVEIAEYLMQRHRR